MHIALTYASLTSLALLPNLVWALPSDSSGLFRRDLTFAADPKDFEKLPNAHTCSPEHQAVIKAALLDARKLADAGVEMEMWHPAYRTFFDPHAPLSAAAAKNPSLQQSNNFNFAHERFVRAHKYLHNTGNDVQIVCGEDVPEGDANYDNSCRKTLYALAFDLEKPTVLICPKFLQFGTTASSHAKLNTVVPRGNNGEIDICKSPNQLDYTYNAGMILFHEMTHLLVVSPKFAADRIHKTNVVDCVYGAYLCGYIAQYSSDVALANADSYANAALSHYMNKACGDVNFQTAFHQPAIEEPLRNDPAKQPMGFKTDSDRCKLPPIAYTNLPNLKPIAPVEELPGSSDDFV